MDKLIETIIAYEGMSFRVVHRVDPQVAATLLSQPAGTLTLRAIADYLVQAIVAWDVVDEDGDPVAITQEGIAPLPGEFLLLMLRQIGAYQHHLGRLSDGDVNA